MSDESTSARGRRGEDEAVRFLLENGFEIVERNFRLLGAEVDIIARAGGELHFIEVKSWRSLDRMDLEHAVNHRKQERIRRVARGYISDIPASVMPGVRFDVLFLSGEGTPVEYIEDAF